MTAPPPIRVHEGRDRLEARAVAWRLLWGWLLAPDESATEIPPAGIDRDTTCDEAAAQDEESAA